jgi:hypothetical protein
MPNSVKYSDRGEKPSRGRSSKGQNVWSRALLGSDGTVTLEIATAEFESGAPTVGQVEKVQVTSVLPDGRKSVLNVNDVPNNTGDVALAIGPRTHGTMLDVQANIDDSRGKRTDVVTTQPKVVHRPDLRVLPLDLPPRVQVGMPFDLAATVREMRGDLGARADCVLTVDGAQADRVSGMWVDAAGAASCLFRAPAFTSAGPHSVTIRVEQVAPGDYDLANNSATTSIEAVLPPPVAPGDPVEHVVLDHQVKITQRVGHSKSMQTTFYEGSNGSRSDTHLDVDADHREQNASFMTWTRRTLRPTPGTPVVDGVVSIPARVAFTESSMGNVVETFSLPAIPLTINYGTLPGFGGGCYLSGPYSAGFSLSICTSWDAAGAGETFVQYTRFASEVQYLSRSYQNALDAQGSLSSTASPPSYSISAAGRSFVAYQSSVTYDFLIDAGSFTFGTHPTVALATTPYNADTPPVCSLPSTTTGGQEHVCNQFFDSGLETTGFASTGDPNALP